MTIEQSLKTKLQAFASPVTLEVVNESHMHHRNPGGETHFRVLVVSEKFQGLSRVDRQRQIQSLFEVERSAGLHALTLRALTPDEFAKVSSSAAEFVSPTCQSRGQ